MFRASLTVVTAGLLLIPLAGCGTDSPPEEATPTEAIQRVLEADERLAEVRNHAGENAPLHDGIEAYARGIEELDFEGCPEAFIEAFARHREAWRTSIPFFERYADLRGELHDVFETIRGYGGEDQQQLEKHEQAIWSTWEEVEAAQ